MTKTETVYPIQDKGLRLVWQPTVQPENYGPGLIGKKGDFLKDASPYQRDSEVRALCLHHACDMGLLMWSGIQCPHCQDGQALYKIAGEVELKQAGDLELSYEAAAGLKTPLSIKTWLCVAPAERVEAEQA